MKNNIVTYILWGLLALFLAIVGYYACQKSKTEKLKKEQNEEELQQTLRNMGYLKPDSTEIGSSFAGDSNSTTTKPAVSKSGIEEEEKTAPAAKPAAGTGSTTTAAKPTTTVKPSTAPAPAKTTTKSIAGPGTGRWAVRAGTFTYMEGARRRLEEVIKLGYTKAEISKTSDGKAAVVVFRSNDKNAAIQVVDKLETKGIDAAVFDRKN
jgi:cytoskeletal protein RodZ